MGKDIDNAYMMKGIYLYITPLFPSKVEWHGAYCYDFVNALSRVARNYKVVVFTPGDGQDYDIGNLRVHTFRELRLPFGFFPFLFSRINQKRLEKKLKVLGFDISDIAVCHANTAAYVQYPLYIKNHNLKCIAILHHHDLQSFGLNECRMRHNWLYNLILFVSLRDKFEKIDMHVFVSEASRRSFLSAPDTSWTDYSDYKSQMYGLPCRRVRAKQTLIVHNGVDTTLFSNLGKRHKDDGLFVVGCIAHFEPIKDQMTLIRAVEDLIAQGRTNIRVKFIGTGSMLSDCKKFIRRHHLEMYFEFYTEIRHEELPAFYRSLDIFILPSFFEGFGCVCTEAWSCGVPFLTCVGQGMDDIIPDNEKSKWLFNPHDHKELALKIDQYSTNRYSQVLTENIGINDVVERFFGEISK